MSEYAPGFSYEPLYYAAGGAIVCAAIGRTVAAGVSPYLFVADYQAKQNEDAAVQTLQQQISADQAALQTLKDDKLPAAEAEMSAHLKGEQQWLSVTQQPDLAYPHLAKNAEFAGFGTGVLVGAVLGLAYLRRREAIHDSPLGQGVRNVLRRIQDW